MPSDAIGPSDLSSLIDALREQVAARRSDTSFGEEGLRARKKRETRQLISDTATGMFLERGFGAVRVADVATACGVSEKTVYNYFPTKESMFFDRFEDVEADVISAFDSASSSVSPVDAAVSIIVTNLLHSFANWGDHDHEFDPTVFQRFWDLIERTPELRAAQYEMIERMVQVVATSMGARAAVNPDDPEPQIVAHAIAGLWSVEFRSMARHASSGRSAYEIRDAVIEDVRRAGRLIDTGLWSFGVALQSSNGREQLRLAAESANEARKQVLAAIRQARHAWRQVKAEAILHDHHRFDDAAKPRSPHRDKRRVE